MTDFSFYSDRTGGPLPRNHEALPAETARGLVGLIGRRLDSHWLAREYPELCPDGSGIVGTNRTAFSDEIEALIPGVEWPPRQDIFTDEATFDLVEYVARHVATPTNGRFHSFFQHYELTFDQAEGRRRFRDDVNLLLARGGTVFELNEDLQVERRGVPETQVALDQLRPATGDDTLDRLIEAGRKGYLSRKREERETAIEKLWDAYERLKTLDDPSDKKRSINALIGHIADPEWREVIEAEMKSLTTLGNDFRIRHSEASKHEVPRHALDYVAARMANLLVQLLGASGRLSNDSRSQ